MNKKIAALFVLISLSLTGMASAGTSFISMEIATALGSDASYNYTDQTLTIGNGASGWLGYVDEFGVVDTLNFATVNVEVNFSTPSSVSAGSIDFTVGSFKIAFIGYGTPGGAIVLEGGLNGVFTDKSAGLGAVGEGPVTVTASYYSTYTETEQVLVADAVEWLDGTADLSTLSMFEDAFGGYLTANYTSNNTTVQLVNPEWVPEPATLSMLGLGMITLIRRKRK